jgi:hypothetical protein
MLRMMAMENLHEWSWTGWIEVETVRATIEAYGRDLINLPPVPATTRQDNIRYVAGSIQPHPYTIPMIAEFLGWTDKKDDRVQPDDACRVAFMAIDALDARLPTGAIVATRATRNWRG